MAKKRKGTAISVDLSGVKDSVSLPEGEYRVRVSEASIETSKNSGSDYIKFELEVAEGKYEGSKLWHNCSLQPQALFNLKAVLEALGFKIPKKAFDLDLDDLIDQECIVDVVTEVYEGKKKPRIVEFLKPESDEEDDELEEDEEESLEDKLSDLSKEEFKQLCIELGIGSKESSKMTVKKLLKEEFEEEDILEALESLNGEDENLEDRLEALKPKQLIALAIELGMKAKKAKTATVEDILEEFDEEDIEAALDEI